MDVIRQIENDAERGECFLEMNELKVAIDAFKEKLLIKRFLFLRRISCIESEYFRRILYGFRRER